MALEQKQTQCGQQAAALTEALSTLEKLTSVLGDKLQPVRSPRLVCKAESCDKNPEPAIAPLAQFIKDRTEQARRIASQLGSMVEEVEC